MAVNPRPRSGKARNRLALAINIVVAVLGYYVVTLWGLFSG